jgi:hypothetical protein
MLYDPDRFEPLLDDPWDAARVERAIAAIVADADAAFDAGTLWPSRGWDVGGATPPLTTLYLGASGVIWALDQLRRLGHAGTTLDLDAAAVRTLARWRTRPDFDPGEHFHPAAFLLGETGLVLTAFKLTRDAALADDLHVLARSNFANETNDIMWGVPGTLLVALAMHEWTGEPRWSETAREAADRVRARRDADGLWPLLGEYRAFSALHGAAGNTLALLRLAPNATLAAETAAVLRAHAVVEDGLATWAAGPGHDLVDDRGEVRLQWCMGAPGVLAGAWDYLDEDLVLAGAELVWQAGAHRDEKGHGLCHGTAGNGFALLKAFARTSDERWLERARRFAVHALAQAERLAAATGTRRYSLFTGDVGTALYASACLRADPSFPLFDVM